MISGVKSGNYEIREIPKSGWTCSYPNPGARSPKVSTNCDYSIVVTSRGSLTSRDFGNWTTGSVSGSKWEDKNANGIQDVGDAGLSGWTIYVDYNGNTNLDS